MKEIQISSNFDVDDIHRIREANDEIYKNISLKERFDLYKAEAIKTQKIIDAMLEAKIKKIANVA